MIGKAHVLRMMESLNGYVSPEYGTGKRSEDT